MPSLGPSAGSDTCCARWGAAQLIEKGTGFRARQTWVQIPPLSLSRLGGFRKLTEPL